MRRIRLWHWSYPDWNLPILALVLCIQCLRWIKHIYLYLYLVDGQTYPKK